MRAIASIIAVILSLTTSMAQNPGKEMKTLVVFFSRADENYNVGTIEKGNTQIIAEMIAEQTGADLFHIETVKPYPVNYMDCISVARTEKDSNARPAIKGDVRVEDYDIIYIGMPNWWGDMPMAVYSFVEKHNWQGKTIIPFATHEGSGMGGMDKRLAQACKGATMLTGIAIQGIVAQNERGKAKKLVLEWLVN